MKLTNIMICIHCAIASHQSVDVGILHFIACICDTLIVLGEQCKSQHTVILV